jgi:hypothetical protein
MYVTNIFTVKLCWFRNQPDIMIFHIRLVALSLPVAMSHTLIQYVIYFYTAYAYIHSRTLNVVFLYEAVHIGLKIRLLRFCCILTVPSWWHSVGKTSHAIVHRFQLWFKCLAIMSPMKKIFR